MLPADPDHWMKYFTLKHYQAHDVVFSPGDAPETMFFLATGAIEIVTEVAHPTSERPFWIPAFIPYAARAQVPKRVRLSVIGQAGIAGEVNFFVGAPRHYYAIASAETLTYVLTRDRFYEMAAIDPHLAVVIQTAVLKSSSLFILNNIGNLARA